MTNQDEPEGLSLWWIVKLIAGVVVGILVLVFLCNGASCVAGARGSYPWDQKAAAAPAPAPVVAAPQPTPTATVSPTQTPVVVTKVVTVTVTVPITTTIVVTSSAPSSVSMITSTMAITTPVVISATKMGGWEVSYYKGATITQTNWTFELLLKGWSKFPDVDFPTYNFKVKDGVEYGMAESAYCQRSQTCDINVPAMHYRLVTGDYSINGIDSCQGEVTKTGCGIMLINVGNVTAMFRESMIDYGFTVAGRYRNGDALPTTIRALLSHVAYNMTNQEAKVNQGANCSVSDGCQNVRLTFVILSGNEMLLKGTTLVGK